MKADHPDEIASAKARMRSKLLARRQRLPQPVREQASLAVCESLARRTLAQGLIMAYRPIRGEVDPMPFVHTLWESGIEVAFPVVEKGKGLIVRRTNSPAQFVPGAFGVLEPAPTCPRVDPSQISTVLVPALAYDTRGFRLGYGGGYYDRFLPTLSPLAESVGLTYDEMVVERLPVDRHDRPVRWVVTENRFLGPFAPGG